MGQRIKAVRSMLVLLGGWAMLAAGPAAVADSTETAAGTVIEVQIPAPALRGNMLGEPLQQPLAIYLPPGYAAATAQRYPVIYLLNGFTGTHRTWLIDPGRPPTQAELDSRDGRYAIAAYLAPERLDAAIAEGRVPPVIVVAANGRNTYKHSFYVNSPVTGNWEDFIVNDVVNYVDTHLRSIPSAASRGIAGHSGGGNGAMFLAMRHADVFAAVYSMAPCCLGSLFSLPALHEPGTTTPTEFWRDVFTRIAKVSSVADLPRTFTDRQQDFYVNAELAAAAAYAPNVARPPLYANPLFDYRNGELALNEVALQQRLALSPYRLIDKHEQDLRALQGILIDFGEHEMPALVAGNAEFASALANRGIPFIMEVYPDGDHGNLIGARFETRGLDFFATTLNFKPRQEQPD